MTFFTSCYPHHAFLWLFWPTIQHELGNNRMFGDNLWDSQQLAGYKNQPWKRLGYINLSLPRLQPLDNLSPSSLLSATNLWKILLNCQHVNYFYIYAFSLWICSSHKQATLPLSFSILVRSGTPSWMAPSTTTHHGTRCQELLTSDSAMFLFSSLWSNSNPYSSIHQPPWSSFKPLFTQQEPAVQMSCFGRRLLDLNRWRSNPQTTLQRPSTFTFIRDNRHRIKREPYLCFWQHWNILWGMWWRALHWGL